MWPHRQTDHITCGAWLAIIKAASSLVAVCIFLLVSVFLQLITDVVCVVLYSPGRWNPVNTLCAPSWLWIRQASRTHAWLSASGEPPLRSSATIIPRRGCRLSSMSALLSRSWRDTRRWSWGSYLNYTNPFLACWEILYKFWVHVTETPHDQIEKCLCIIYYLTKVLFFPHDNLFSFSLYVVHIFSLNILVFTHSTISNLKLIFLIWNYFDHFFLCYQH